MAEPNWNTFKLSPFLILLIAILPLMAGAPPAHAEPYIPKDSTVVLEKLPSQPTDAWAREVNQLRSEMARNPNNPEPAIRLARLYISKGRAEADPRYYGYAQATLSRWWKIPEPLPSILVLRAAIRQSSHDFEGALADLSKALKAEPGNLQAWLTRAIILQVQGKYVEAKRSCNPISEASKRMPSLNLLATICGSSVSGFNGEAIQNYRTLQRALEYGPSAGLNERLWALTVLADLAQRTGHIQEAEKYYQKAMALEVRDSFLLGAYADFLLEQDRSFDAFELLKNETRADGLLLRLALAEQNLGLPNLSNHIEALRARFDSSRLRGDMRHLREEAQFTLKLLMDPITALKLSMANWKTQREPEDARILLESALAANHLASAKPVLDWLEEKRLEDVRLLPLLQKLRDKT